MWREMHARVGRYFGGTNTNIFNIFNITQNSRKILKYLILLLLFFITIIDLLLVNNTIFI